MAKKRKWRFRVSLRIPGDVLIAELEKSSAGAACRAAFRDWIVQGLIPRPPATTNDGGFEGVDVQVLRRVS